MTPRDEFAPKLVEGSATTPETLTRLARSPIRSGRRERVRVIDATARERARGRGKRESQA
jgi:hypothetical protein